ncbi:hypothetical protein [Sneathiella sp.]|uniref:hypothetical protein n=1 Tax=Sneathiella sp. TaxID=1964365 RepID=UPI00356367F4
MNSLVAFEAILAVCCLITINLARQAFFPASLFWAFGAVSVGIMAVLGGLTYAGFTEVDAFHLTAKRVAGSMGLASFTLGAIAGLFAGFFNRFCWGILLTSVVALCILLLLGLWRVSTDVQMGMVGIIFLIGLVRLISSGMLALYLILGVVFLVLSDVAVKWLASNTGLDGMNIYHILLSLAVVSFGLSASRDEWD